MAGNLTAMIAAIFSGGVSTDPYFNLTTLLLSTTATNGQQNNTFQDSSTNNFTITRNPATGPNAPTQGTFSPFSQTGWGNYFDGTGDYLSGNTNLWATTTSTFTVDGWVYPTSVPGAKNMLLGDFSPTGATLYVGVYINSSRQLVLEWYDGATKTCTSTSTINLNEWSYVAVRVSSNAISMYVNSATASGLSGTTTLTNRGGTTNWTIGQYASASNWNGYISNIRMSTIARTVAIPTAPFTPDADTKLLTCQSNRFVDTSSNAYAVTPSGNTTVVPFSPFNPTSAWSASTVGGSGYFDGTSDYLTVNDNAALELGSSNFCLEFMYYPTSSANTDFVTKRVNASSYGVIIVQTGLALNFWLSSSGSSWDLFSNAALGSVTLNAWNHLAIYRIGNAWYSSLNGTITTLSASLSGSVVNNAANWNIGGNNYASGSVIGYLSNFRLVIGSSVYTSTSAPIPTAPLTAVTNTQLLLNFTNSGIYDATAKNVLETVGNAQVSTAQSKWSPTSMYFDGTGDYLAVPDNPYQRIGTGNFTVECWVYRNSSGTYGLIGKGTGTTGWLLSLNSSNQVVFTYGSSTITSTGTVSATTWTHIAVVREGTSTNQTKIYISGTNDGTGTISTDFTQTNVMYVAADRTAGSNANAYVQDARVTRYARYTANFSVPTAAFPVQ